MKNEFIAALRTERQGLLAAVDGLNEETLTTVPVCGAWTARDVLAHLAEVDLALLSALKQVRAGEPVKWAWESAPDGDAWNQNAVASRQSRSLSEIRAELEQTRQDVLADLASWPEDSGPFGPESWDPEKSPICWIPSHDQEHGTAVRSLGAR